MTKSNFWPISPLKLKCKTLKWRQQPIYGSIMLKIFVCHFFTKLHPFPTYEGEKKFFGAYLMDKSVLEVQSFQWRLLWIWWTGGNIFALKMPNLIWYPYFSKHCSKIVLQSKNFPFDSNIFQNTFGHCQQISFIS